MYLLILSKELREALITHNNSILSPFIAKFACLFSVKPS